MRAEQFLTEKERQPDGSWPEIYGEVVELTEENYFFKQKTAYEISRSDWSSDVCSSDLFPSHDMHRTISISACCNCSGLSNVIFIVAGLFLSSPINSSQIGRASCRERVCQYV